MSNIQTITTFRDIRGHTLDSLKRNDPFCFNYVAVEKFKITVEKIDEPNEVYKARLEELFKKESGYRGQAMVLNKARELGIQLDTSGD